MYKKYAALLCATFLSLASLYPAALTQTWQFNIANNKWTNVTNSDVWTWGGYTFTKSGGSNTPSGGFSEAWTYNPATTRWTEGSESWGSTAVGRWQEYVAGETWHFFAPSTGNLRGTWRLNGTGAIWTYNDTDQEWNETGTSNTKLFPPFLPEQVIVQHQEILSAYDYLTTREIPDGTTNISWEDDFEALVYDYTTGAWTWTAPDYEPTGNTTSEWKDNVEFSGGSPAYSERWTIAEAGDTTLGRAYTNASANLTGGEVVYHNTASNTWSYANSATHAWTFDPVNVDWINQGTNAQYEYNTRARSWTQIDKPTPLQDWQSKYDSTEGWIWHDVDNDVKWQYDTGVWKNLSTSATYTANGTQLQDNSSNNWNYSAANWTQDGSSTTTATLFPLLPPNPAGQLGRIQQQGYLLAAAHVPSGAGYKTRYEGHLTSFDAALALRGTARASAMSPLKTPTSDLINLINPWQTKYLQLSNPHHADTHVFAPATSGTFDIWNRTGWRFAEAGKAGILFKAKGTNKLTIGLGASPSSSSEYKLVLQESPTTGTIHDAGGQIASTTISAFASDDTAFYDYWLAYNNGAITFGTGQYIGMNTVYAFDLSGSGLTLNNAANLDTMNYVSFTAQSGAAYQFKDIRVLPHDTATSLGGSYCINTRIDDEVLIGGWQQDFDDYKDDLLLVPGKTTIAERSTTFKVVSDGLAAPLTEVNTTKAATDTSGYGATDALNTSLSRTNFDTVYSEIDNASSVSLAYQSAVTHFTTIDTANASIFVKLNKSLDESTFTSELTTVKATISSALNTLEALFTTAKTEANALKDISGNSSLSTIADLFAEELALVQAQQASLDHFEKTMLLKYHEGVVNREEEPSFSQLTALFSADDAQAAAKTALETTLAADLAAGNINLFASTVGPNSLILKQNTEQVRTETSSQLSTNTELHTFPSGSHAYTDATANKTVITVDQKTVHSSLEQTVVDLVKTTNPGTDKATQPDITSLAVETTSTAESTASIANQKIEATAGTSGTPTNILVSAQGTVEEVKINVEDKTQAFVRVYAAGSTIGLGKTDLTKDSGKAMTVMGNAKIVPDREGRFYVYSDTHITADDPSISPVSTAISAGPSFGKSTTDTRCIGTLPVAKKGKHKVEFLAPGQPNNLVIGRNVELDLTSFGKGDTAGGQRIVFAKDVSLILEAGASIRFPYLEPTNAEKAPILDFAGDNARLVFIEPQNRESTSWTTTKNGIDAVRNKIFGTGSIVFSGKNARMEILRGAHVAIEADYISPRTDVSIELTGENSRIELGNESLAGGSLQVGNFQRGGYNRFFTDDYPNNSTNSLIGHESTPFSVRDCQIDFSLTINGTNAKLHIDREGFLGIGAGVVNKEGKPNGSTTSSSATPGSDTWQIQSLYDVGNIKINITDGCLHHHSIAPGNDKNASLLAIGPIDDEASYQFAFNKKLLAPIKGGGNIMYMTANADSANDEATPYKVHLWDAALYAGAVNGEYSLLGPSQMMIDRRTPSRSAAGSYNYGLGTITNTGSNFSYVGGASDLYSLLTMHDYISDGKYVVAKRDGSKITASYVNASKKIKTVAVNFADVTSFDGDPVPLEDIGRGGHLEGDGNSPPKRFHQ